MTPRERYDARMAALELFAGRCVWCGSPLEPGGLTLDHLVARAHGGLDRFPNLAPACEPCNHDRCCVSPADWAFLCALRGRRVRLSELRTALRLLAAEPDPIGPYARRELGRLTDAARLCPFPWPLAGNPTTLMEVA